MKLNFEIADRFYEQMLASLGKKSRDQKRREKSEGASKPFEPGRDPIKAADSIDNLLTDFDWLGKVQKESLFLEWEKLVGKESAAASKPVDLNAGVLTVQCRSTAWATQLRLLSEQILSRIREQYPEQNIEFLKFVGPAAPNWKKGPRSVPGRGPRDTYG